MAEVSQQMFLGTEQVFGFVDGKWAGINSYEQSAVQLYSVRNDAYSSSILLAMPYSNYSELGMQTYTSSIDGLIRTGNINNSYMVRMTSSAASYSFASASVVSSGSGAYDWAAEGYTSSLSLYNSSNAGVILTSSAWISSQNFVVECWYRKTENFTNPPFHRQFFGNNNGDNVLQSYSTGNVFRYFINGDNSWSTTPNATLVNNTWYHIAFVKSSTNVYVYLNGNRIGVGTRAASVVSSGATAALLYNIIGNVSNNDGAGGNFQDFRFYLGTDKGYTGSTITVPLSIVDKN
jgi:Concanavalin A-like lectin/glucanases superfamily